jgi:hypothetical protein
MESLAYGLTPFQKRERRGLLGTLGGRNVCKLLVLLLSHRRIRVFKARQYEESGRILLL